MNGIWNAVFHFFGEGNDLGAALGGLLPVHAVQGEVTADRGQKRKEILGSPGRDAFPDFGIEDLKSDDFDYGFFFVPTDDSGKEPVMNVQVDQAFMVNPKAENADWAVKFMEFFLSEQMGTWSDATKQPCITGATTENTTDFLKTILDVKASGNTVGYGEFTVPFTSAYTAAYRKALTAYATYCCTGKTTDGVNSVESCIEYMQELFDEEFAQAGL